MSFGAVLLAIDLQPSLIDVIPDGRRVLSRCQLAVAAAQGIGLPIVFTEQVPAKLGVTHPAVRDLAPDAPALAKDTFSALADDAVLAAIREHDAEHVILCGLETPVCIYQTALGALASDLQVTVLTDAVGARRGDDAAVCFSALRHAGIHLLPVETVFYALLHDAGHPFFKRYIQLVKSHA